MDVFILSICFNFAPEIGILWWRCHPDSQGSVRWLGDSAAHGESQSARELEKSQQSSFFHAGGKHEEGVTYKHKKSSILRVVNQ